MAKNSVKPFELLTEYERLSLKHTVQLQEAEVKDQWSGVGFKVDEINSSNSRKGCSFLSTK